jgi:hypothetical protein
MLVTYRNLEVDGLYIDFPMACGIETAFPLSPMGIVSGCISPHAKALSQVLDGWNVYNLWHYDNSNIFLDRNTVGKRLTSLLELFFFQLNQNATKQAYEKVSHA